jgi:hypothetical protein
MAGVAIAYLTAFAAYACCVVFAPPRRKDRAGGQAYLAGVLDAMSRTALAIIVLAGLIMAAWILGKGF